LRNACDTRTRFCFLFHVLTPAPPILQHRERVENWITQLKGEGFFEGGSVPAIIDVTPTVVAEPVTVFAELEDNAQLLEETIEKHSNGGFAPHYNSKSKTTMWVSPDGRTCYYTEDKTTSFAP
jgi:hypothetical protein